MQSRTAQAAGITRIIAGGCRALLQEFACWYENYAALALRVIAASVLPGLPFAIARDLLHQHSGIVNLDFFILTLLSISGSPGVASVLVVCTCLLETMRLMDAVYFFSQEDLTFLVHFLADTPVWAKLTWLLTLAVLCAAVLLLWRLLIPRQAGRRVWAAAVPVAVLAAVLLAVDVAQGYNPLLKLPHAHVRQHMVGEVLLRMPVELWQASQQNMDSTSTPLLHSATDSLWQPEAFAAARANVVVVVVESMGLLESGPARERMFAPLEDALLKRTYRITTGAVPFTGSTVVGEMRELCRLRTGVHVTQATLTGKEACLPKQYAALGYQTVSYHGYRETMFRRGDWYPMLGFQQMNFAAQMSNLPFCNGAFFGVCDAAVAEAMEQRLSATRAAGGPPQFLYWMTLTSHLPVDESRVPAAGCPLAGDAGVCGQLAYVQTVLASVRRLALDSDVGPTAIVVVGDHAPPYASLERRELFDEHAVPFVALIPKGLQKGG